MPFPPFTDLARHDVDNFIDGLGGDAPLPIPVRLSVPDTRTARENLASIIANVYFFMDVQSALVMPWTYRCGVIFKVTAHVLRHGSLACTIDPFLLPTIESAARMIAERPSFITDPINVSSMARIYDQVQLNRARAKAFTRPAFVFPRPTVWRSKDRRIVLSELVDPWHLIDEGEMMGHCIGSVFETGIKHPKPTDLRYWRWINEGRSHVFSLEVDGMALFTFHVGAVEQRLREVQGSSLPCPHERSRGPHLVTALSLLKELFPGLYPAHTLHPNVLLAFRAPRFIVGA